MPEKIKNKSSKTTQRRSANVLKDIKEKTYLRYMAGASNKELLELYSLSSATLNGWIKKGDWDTKRAAKTVTRGELVNKTLRKINELLDGDEFNADSLSKMGKVIEQLDKSDSPVMAMDAMISFGKYVQYKSTVDKEIDLAFLQKLNVLQDEFITKKINGQ